jgi:hypothetical protein
MTITAAATGTPIPKPVGALQFIDENGKLTNHALQLLSQWHEFMVGTNRIIPCNASAALNVITLTPLDSGPVIEKYVDHDGFAFVASASSTGAVTATVVPRSGTLSTLKVYVTNGSAQAGNGDITSGLFYIAYYVDSLDGGLGGLVLM